MTMEFKLDDYFSGKVLSFEDTCYNRMIVECKNGFLTYRSSTGSCSGYVLITFIATEHHWLNETSFKVFAQGGSSTEFIELLVQNVLNELPQYLRYWNIRQDIPEDYISEMVRSVAQKKLNSLMK